MSQIGRSPEWNLLSRLQVNLETAARTQCWPDWRDDDYVPAYSKLYFILSGEGTIVIEEETFHPSAGSLVLMPAGRKQSYSTNPSDPFLKFWCHFTAEINDANLFGILKAPHASRPEDPKQMAQLFGRLVELQSCNQLSSRFEEKSLLLQILAIHLSSSASLLFSSSESMSRISDILDFMRAHLHEELSMEALAREFHFHPHSLARLFRLCIGVPPTAALRRIRIETACRLLASTHDSQQEIARLTGFFDVHHFARTFKAHTGYTPGDYRRMLVSPSGMQAGFTME